MAAREPSSLTGTWITDAFDEYRNGDLTRDELIAKLVSKAFATPDRVKDPSLYGVANVDNDLPPTRPGSIDEVYWNGYRTFGTDGGNKFFVDLAEARMAKNAST